MRRRAGACRADRAILLNSHDAPGVESDWLLRRSARSGRLLRYLIGGLTLALLAAIASAYLLLPTLVDETRLERRVVAAIAGWTGRDIGIGGPVEINLLPRPLVSLAGPRLGVADDASGLTGDRLDLDVAFLPLLAGRLEVVHASLVRPHIWSTESPGTLLDTVIGQLAAALAGGDGELPIRAIEVVDGTISRTATTAPLIERINARIERDPGSGTSSLLATGGVRGPASTIPLRLEAQLGHTMPGRPIPLQLALSLAAGEVSDTLSLRGHARHEPHGNLLDGRLEISAGGTIDLLNLLPIPDPTMTVESIPVPALPWTLAADLTLEHSSQEMTLSLEDASLSLDGQSMVGSVEIRTGAERFLAIDLASGQLRLPETPPWGPDELSTLLAQLPAETTGRIALAADELDWRGQRLRQVSLDLTLDGSGRANIASVRAVLPGPGDLAFSGSLSGIGGTGPPRLTGELALAVQDPSKPYSTIAPPPAMLRQSTTLALDTTLDWAAGEVTLRDFDLSLDTLQASGGLAFRAGDAQRRPRLALRAGIDRLDLDQLLNVAAPEGMLQDWLGVVARADFALDLEIERTSLGDTRLGRLVLEAEAEAARLRIDRLSLADIGGSAFAVQGSIDAITTAFDLNLGLDVASLPRLLRLAERPAPPALALLGPLNLRVGLTGDSKRANLDARLEADLLEATAEADLRDWQTGTPSGNVALDLDASDAASLLRQLLAVPITSPLLDGELDATLEGSLEHGAPAAGVLDLELGQLALKMALMQDAVPSGAGEWLELAIGPLDLAAVGQLYALATPLFGLVPGPPERWLGYWPEQPLDWRWLETTPRQLSVRLTPADPDLPPIRIDGEVGYGRLRVPAFSWQGEESRIEGAMALQHRPGAGVDLTLDVAFAHLAAAHAMTALGADPGAVAGQLDLSARLRSSGRSIRQLVGGLDGTIDLVLVDGRIGGLAASAAVPKGVPGASPLQPSVQPENAAATEALPPLDLERLVATFEVERGVVRPAEGPITLRTPARVGNISGYADILAWMLEGEIVMEASEGQHQPRWRLLGPLTDPRPLSPSLGAE